MSKSVQYRLKLDPQQFASDTGKMFRGMTVSRKEDDYNVIIRASDADGVAIYAMWMDEDLEVAFQSLMDTLLSKQSSYFWRFDGWANA